MDCLYWLGSNGGARGISEAWRRWQHLEEHIIESRAVPRNCELQLQTACYEEIR